MPEYIHKSAHRHSEIDSSNSISNLLEEVPENRCNNTTRNILWAAAINEKTSLNAIGNVFNDERIGQAPALDRQRA